MDIRGRVEEVRNALDRAGRDLHPVDWKELLEEVAADIEGHLDAIELEAQG